MRFLSLKLKCRNSCSWVTLISINSIATTWSFEALTCCIEPAWASVSLIEFRSVSWWLLAHLRFMRVSLLAGTRNGLVLFGCLACFLTHSLTHARTHSIIHSFIYSYMHAFTLLASNALTHKHTLSRERYLLCALFLASAYPCLSFSAWACLCFPALTFVGRSLLGST